MAISGFLFEIFDIKEQLTLTLKWTLWSFEVVFEVLCWFTVTVASFCIIPRRKINDLEMTLKRSLKITKTVPFECLDTVSYSHSLATMAVSLAIYEIFSVKEWRDLEMWVRGRSKSLKVSPFDRPHTISYLSAIVSVALSCTIFELFNVQWYSDLEIGLWLKVTQGHWQWYHLKAGVRFPIRVE